MYKYAVLFFVCTATAQISVEQNDTTSENIYSQYFSADGSVIAKEILELSRTNLSGFLGSNPYTITVGVLKAYDLMQLSTDTLAGVQITVIAHTIYTPSKVEFIEKDKLLGFMSMLGVIRKSGIDYAKKKSISYRETKFNFSERLSVGVYIDKNDNAPEFIIRVGYYNPVTARMDLGEYDDFIKTISIAKKRLGVE